MNRIDYEKQLSRVTTYVHDHLDEQLDLNTLASVANLSPYHWHRVYHALYGETIAATVRRLRLHRAAGYLAQTSMPVREVAVRSGYKNPQTFTRVFRSVYGMPPAHYRKNGNHVSFQWRERGMPPPDAYELATRTLPELRAVSIEHVGPYMEIGRAFDALYGWLGARDLVGPGMRSVGLYYDDPSSVPEDELRSRACVISDGRFPIEFPLEQTTISGGSYAVLRYEGPYATMKAAYQWLFGEWVVRSGMELADAPVIEEYVNSPRDTPPTELVTVIHLPLR